jgi:hypothetical protein
MSVEIKELLIRAFVTDQKHDDHRKERPKKKQIKNAQDSISMVANMLKQEKER